MMHGGTLGDRPSPSPANIEHHPWRFATFPIRKVFLKGTRGGRRTPRVGGTLGIPQGTPGVPRRTPLAAYPGEGPGGLTRLCSRVFPRVYLSVPGVGGRFSNAVILELPSWGALGAQVETVQLQDPPKISSSGPNKNITWGGPDTPPSIQASKDICRITTA